MNKGYKIVDKCYIGREEAFEYAMANGIDTLPNKGKEVITSNGGGKVDTIIGRDAEGYYIGYFEATI